MEALKVWRSLRIMFFYFNKPLTHWDTRDTVDERPAQRETRDTVDEGLAHWKISGRADEEPTKSNDDEMQSSFTDESISIIKTLKGHQTPIETMEKSDEKLTILCANWKARETFKWSPKDFYMFSTQLTTMDTVYEGLVELRSRYTVDKGLVQWRSRYTFDKRLVHLVIRDIHVADEGLVEWRSMYTVDEGLVKWRSRYTVDESLGSKLHCTAFVIQADTLREGLVVFLLQRMTRDTFHEAVHGLESFLLQRMTRDTFHKAVHGLKAFSVQRMTRDTFHEAVHVHMYYGENKWKAKDLSCFSEDENTLQDQELPSDDSCEDKLEILKEENEQLDKEMNEILELCILRLNEMHTQRPTPKRQMATI